MYQYYRSSIAQAQPLVSTQMSNLIPLLSQKPVKLTESALRDIELECAAELGCPSASCEIMTPYVNRHGIGGTEGRGCETKTELQE